MIDSHAHLHDPVYDHDRDGVIQRLRDQGIESIITVGCDLESSIHAVELANRHDFIYATVGIHPHEAGTATPGVYDELIRLSQHPRVVGWGETGLDFYYMHSTREDQIKCFIDQIHLAKEQNLPVVVHMRDSEEDTIKILTEEEVVDVGGVFHCFTGTPGAIEVARDLNFMVSISGIVTFPNAKNIHELVARIPLDRLLVETDCPYLTPVPYRGKRNEPSYVKHVVEKIAELTPSYGFQEIAAATSQNAKRLFQIS